MKIAHVYDDIEQLIVQPGDPEDIGSEWEDARTIQGQAEAMRVCGHEVVAAPFDEHLIVRLTAEHPDCVFNISEGKRGKDRESIVPAICKQLGIACTSSDAVAMGLTLDKALSKAVARANGIPTPDWQIVRQPDDLAAIDIPYPLFVKPNGEGSSMGIRPESLVLDRGALEAQAMRVVNTIGPALIEATMPGRELHVAMLGNDDPEIFPIGEIRTGRRVYDKSMKSKDRMEEEVICPAELDDDTADKLKAWSRRLFTEMGLAGPVRFDYKCDSDGIPNFLEANPLPGMSRYYSVYTIQAKAAGYTYEQMIGRIIELAMERHSR